MYPVASVMHDKSFMLFLELRRLSWSSRAPPFNDGMYLYGNKVIVLKCDEIIHEELGMFRMERTIILRECRYYSHLFVESYFCALQFRLDQFND